MEVKGKKVLVFGLGISGIGAGKILERQGAEVVLYDGNKKLMEEKVRQQSGADSNAKIIIGEFPEEILAELDMTVLSPGVPTDLPVIEKMRKQGITVIGEVELAYQFGKGDVLAITGTNGKTTTTTLLGEIMKNYQDDVFVVGNIGTPYTTAVEDMTENSITVAEMSSFQLESIVEFRPRVSAILNFTPDHLNRHHTMEAYVNAKKNIAKNQTEEDYCILNYEDKRTREFGNEVKARVLYFSSQRKLEEGIYLEEGNIIYNHENVMAACAMAAVYGVPVGVIRESVKAFGGVEHRIEYVTEKNGVTYYNDSKGTNPDAAIKGIQAMKRPTVLIGGGYDKGSEYTEWIESFDGKVKKLILLGDTREKIAADAEKCGFTDYMFVDSFEEAVLLSPACASWDMFPSYEVRGEKFKEIVNSL